MCYQTWALQCVESHNHILVGHVIIHDEVVTRRRMWFFITLISSIWHPWLMTKWRGHPIVITMIKNWLPIIWYKHRQPYPPLTHVPIYLPTHPPTHPLACMFSTYPLTHPPTHYHGCQYYGLHSFECSSMYLIFSLIPVHS